MHVKYKSRDVEFLISRILLVALIPASSLSKDIIMFDEYLESCSNCWEVKAVPEGDATLE